MGIFKSKQEKEIEKKMLIKKTVNTMNKHIAKLQEQKKVYIEAAKKAKSRGLSTQENLAISGLKMTMAQEKKAHEMLLNFEIVTQMKDMTTMVSEFLRGLSVMSKEMTKLTDNKEFMKVQQQFEAAMSGVEMQQEQMDLFLDMNESTFATQNADPDSVSDEEITALIDDEVISEASSDDSIEAKMQEIRKKMKE